VTGTHGKLRQDRIAEGLGGDAGAVGDEKYGASAMVGAVRRKRGTNDHTEVRRQKSLE
jgi:hypothetical protein